MRAGILVALLQACVARPPAPPAPVLIVVAQPPAPELDSYRDSIPGTLVRFDMIAIPGGTVGVETPTATREVQLAPFWIGRSEVTWDEYDVFAFRLDMSREEAAAAADAESRPSRPYGAPDRGYGHDGFPAIGITYDAAVAYAEWLSTKTGRKYQLPTDAQWTRAATAQGTTTAAPALDSVAWHAGNSGDATHRVGTLGPNGFGLHDVFGNVAEWVMGADGKPVTRGGSFIDPPAAVGAAARAHQTDDWNSTDPQLPKSRWWLSDAPFVGFRLVRVP